MYSEVYGVTLFGMSAFLICVETDTGPGLPCFDMSGFLNNEVKEAKERIIVSIKNSGYKIKPQRTVINFSPAGIKKNGTGLDLPCAIGVLAANGIIEKEEYKDFVFIGELSFNGQVKPVNGCLPAVIKVKESGYSNVIIPKQNEAECRFVKDINIYTTESLYETVAFLKNDGVLDKVEYMPADESQTKSNDKMDFKDIKGQNLAKDAAVIAAAGMHNILFSGPPGSGKSMIAKRIPTILPELTYSEKLELTKIYSIAGLLKENREMIGKRPFREPGQNLTEAALLGGGGNPRPGEVTLASKGVLFLDELPQFNSRVLESLRQPLEDKEIIITRSRYSVHFPADFMLVGAMNPCKCGYYPNRNKCTCTPSDLVRYMGRLSKPLLDRFDICIRTESLNFKDMYEGKEESPVSSGEMREKVSMAMEIQKDRFKDKEHLFNSRMTIHEIEKYCRLDNETKKYFEKIFEMKKLTARGCHKILKVARTVADINAHDNITVSDLSRAVSYRNPFYGGADNE